MDMLQVLIADDHPIFRNGMRALLSSIAGIEVAGEATTEEEAVELADKLQPDVILMDLQMPDGSGIEATKRILESSPHIRILVVTMFEEDELVFAALRAGARGYVLKGAGPTEIVRAIQAVGSGEAIFSPTIAQHLLAFFVTSRSSEPSTHLFPDLTERERSILDHMVQGRTNEEIAQKLVLSLKTIRNNVSNICSKLQVVDRTQAILRAQQARWRQAGKL